MNASYSLAVQALRRDDACLQEIPGEKDARLLVIDNKVHFVFKTQFRCDQLEMDHEQGLKREVLNYTLDCYYQSGVPSTYSFDNEGVLVEYIEGAFPLSTPLSQYETLNFNARAVRQIALAHFLKYDRDTNLSNFLLRQEGEEVNIYPIDGAYIFLPNENVKPRCGHPFLYMKNTIKILEEPFDEREKKWIQQFPMEKVAKMLRGSGIEERAVEIAECSLSVLRQSLEKGLTLRELLESKYGEKKQGECICL